VVVVDGGGVEVADVVVAVTVVVEWALVDIRDDVVVVVVLVLVVVVRWGVGWCSDALWRDGGVAATAAAVVVWDEVVVVATVA
jgi:hypothetical protein